jgi:hypothetical protein
MFLFFRGKMSPVFWASLFSCPYLEVTILLCPYPSCSGYSPVPRGWQGSSDYCPYSHTFSTKGLLSASCLDSISRRNPQWGLWGKGCKWAHMTLEYKDDNRCDPMMAHTWLFTICHILLLLTQHLLQGSKGHISSLHGGTYLSQTSRHLLVLWL